VSNLKESLQTKGIPTEVEGHKGYVGMNDEGVLMEGDKVPEDRRMMEKGDTTEQEKIDSFVVYLSISAFVCLLSSNCWSKYF
jgi:hypothetical protein